MNNTAVVVGWADGIVLIQAQIRLDVTTVKKERRTVEGGTETRNDGLGDLVVSRIQLERAVVATPDVVDRGLSKPAVRTIALHDVAAHAAFDLASAHLGGNSQRFPSILGPDLVNIILIVVAKSSRLVDSEAVWGQDPDRAVRASLAQATPRTSIFLCLFLEPSTRVFNDIWTDTIGRKLATTLFAKFNAKRKADEIDVAKVNPGTPVGVEGQLDKPPVDSGAGIGRVLLIRLNESGTAGNADNAELESTGGEVHAAGAQGLENLHVDALADLDRDFDLVLVDLDGGRGRGTGVEERSITTHEDDAVAAVEARDICIYSSAEIVDELKGKLCGGSSRDTDLALIIVV